ncbi:hypothetical protein [Hydrogenimonas sp. SS33]|uniref:hypothetical protein n=1 Tax=Hydrogenimonas leucolamina TaxID=2954236 RepID=UPI00336C1ED2
MALEYCYPLAEGETLNEDHPEWPLFAVTIHGSDRERVKLSKRLVCAVKHLPLRLRIRYEKDVERSLEAGVAKDPTLTLGDTILAEGLVAAERLTEIFETLLADGKR